MGSLFALGPYMLNTRNEDKNTVFHSYLACFMNALPLNMYEFLSYTGFTRRNTLFIFLWLCPRNAWLTRLTQTNLPVLSEIAHRILRTDFAHRFCGQRPSDENTTLKIPTGKWLRGKKMATGKTRRQNGFFVAARSAGPLRARCGRLGSSDKLNDVGAGWTDTATKADG